jgi:Protein phosphatase 2C
MFTFVEAMSLAGDRAKQNDDALGFARGCAWVIDGATDLHDAPLSGAASDAAWVAHFVNAYFHAHAGARDEAGLRALVRGASTAAAEALAQITRGAAYEKWQSPIASLLIAAETDDGVLILDVGDCRGFARDAAGAAHAGGGPEEAAGAESRFAAQTLANVAGPALKNPATIDTLRRLRALQNGGGGTWTFCLDPACASEARVWRLKLARPAHLLLASDGLAALADRYDVYDSGALVEAARTRGLQELGAELRGIETADADSRRHPRFKRSDDATGLLFRLT